MNAVVSWPVLVTLAAGVGTVLLIFYLLQYRDTPGAKWLVLTLAGQATFCFAYGIGLTVFDPTLRLWLEILSFIGLSWLGVPFLAFALAYTGRGKLLHSWFFRVLLAFPLASTVFLPLNGWHNLFWTDFEIDSVFGVATVSYSFQPAAFFGILGAGIVVGIGAAILFDTVLSYGPLYRGEALAVALSPVPPIAGLFPWLFGFGPAPQLNTIAIGLLPHVLLDAYAFVGSGMFEFYPATNRAAERSALDDLRSPVLILESAGRVVDLNESAEQELGIDSDQAMTQPVSTVLDGRIHEDEILESSGSQRLSARQNGRQQEFRVEPAPLTDSGGNHVGYTLLFQDITEAVQREERLSVLNRVLRHNLRNDLTVIQGFVDEAGRRSDKQEVTDMLERATDKSRTLVEAGEKAREIEATIGAENTSNADLDVKAQLQSLVSTLETEYPAANLTVECDFESFRTDPDAFESVLTQLLENALVHNNGDTPTVSITATRLDGQFELVISDDGPGIPDHEVETLQHGEETALEHGSGLGLWLVKWGVMRLGGDIDFETENGGTTVRLVVPEQTES